MNTENERDEDKVPEDRVTALDAFRFLGLVFAGFGLFAGVLYLIFRP